MFAWGILVMALFFASSAATALKQIEAPPLVRASWRMYATWFLTACRLFSFFSIVLLPGLLWQMWKTSPEVMRKLRERSTWAWIALSGFSLAVHFGSWIASLDLTSLPHSLLFVTASPIVIVLIAIAKTALPTQSSADSPRYTRVPALSKLEAAGALVSFAGSGLLLIDLRSDRDVSAAGDALAFLGAVAFVVLTQSTEFEL